MSSYILIEPPLYIKEEILSVTKKPKTCIHTHIYRFLNKANDRAALLTNEKITFTDTTF